jgi:hypothetical protein
VTFPEPFLDAAMMLGADRNGPQTQAGAAPTSFAFSRRRNVRVLDTVLVGAVAAVALAGCGFSDGPGTLIVDPGKYSVYHCNDLVARSKYLLSREQELRGLMDKASEGGGGTVIGALAYRSDYESVKSEQKLLQRTAAEKKCDLVAPASNYQSDQTIR